MINVSLLTSKSRPQNTKVYFITLLVSEVCACLVSPPKMSRRDLTLAEKIVFLDKIKQQPQNTSQRRLMVITGLAKTTISRLIKQESELREEWAQCEGRGGTYKKRKHVSSIMPMKQGCIIVLHRTAR